jgi:hypothetical protein
VRGRGVDVRPVLPRVGRYAQTVGTDDYTSTPDSPQACRRKGLASKAGTTSSSASLPVALLGGDEFTGLSVGASHNSVNGRLELRARLSSR